MGDRKKPQDPATRPLGSRPQKKTEVRDDLSAGNASMTVVMSRLVREFIAPHWRVLAIGLVAMVFVAATTGALPYLMKVVADEILEGKNEALLFTLPIVILVVMTSRALADWVSRVADAWLGNRVIADLRIRMFDVLAYADLSWIQDTHSGRFVSAFVNDVPVVDRAGAKPLTAMVKNGLSTIFLVGMMFYLDWKLSILTIMGMPIALLFLRRQKKRIKGASRKSLREAGDFGSLLTQTIQGIRVVKAYGQEDAEAARVRTVVNNIMFYLVKTAKARAAVAPITEFVAGLGFAAAVFYAGWQSIYANVTLGDFMGFITATMLMYQPLRSLFNLQAQMTEGVTAANRIFSIIDHDRKVTEPENAPALKVPEGRITFSDVEFAYEQDLPVLSNFELDIEPGEKIALVGPSGSGKSTVLNLVLRFFDPQTGTVRIDGQDISQVSLASLRSQIALLTQDPVLFDDSIANNIAYGSEGAGMDRIVDAAKAAAAHDFISALPRGYETRVGEDGSRLSGGEKQRIAFARAMLRGAP
ncbi:MAG TPA: ABC transporter ATP-binding protein, partial [Afifellaceae bacterium]|nr:ABC transporter ATP-binding protein [Afifellaceae bacterium]